MAAVGTLQWPQKSSVYSADWTDCNQTMWPYGVRDMPSGLLCGKYAETELPFIHYFAV